MRTIVVAAALALLAACSEATPEAVPGPQDEASSSTGDPPASSGEPTALTLDAAEEFRLAPSGPVGPLAVAEGAAYAVVGELGEPESEVLRFDPDDGRVRWRVPGVATSLTAGFGSLWVADFEADRVRRLDARTGEELAVVRVGPGPEGLLAAHGGLWVANHHGGTLARIDPDTNSVDLTTPVAPEGRSGPSQLAATEDWVVVGVPNGNAVVAVDPATGDLVHEVVTARDVIPCGSLTADDQSSTAVWVTSCFETEHVGRVDLATDEQVSSPALGGFAGAAHQNGETVWFATTYVGNPMSPDDDELALTGVDRHTGSVLAGATLPFTGDWTAVGAGHYWIGGIDDGTLRAVALADLDA